MITVVIPALNEEDGIADSVRHVRNTLEGAGFAPYEVIVVDDGSTDATGSRAVEAGAIVIRHPHNAGYGHSLKDGIRRARHDLIVITDADGTYPVDAIPAMVEMYRAGFDLVVGARQGQHYRESLIKMPLRWLLRCLVEWTAGRKIPDINSGLRLFRRSTILEYFPHLCDTFSFTTSMTLAYSMTGRFIGYVPIAYRARIGRTKVRLFRDSLRTLQYILEASLYYNPLRIFFLLSALCCGASFIGFAIASATRLTVFYFTGIGLFLTGVLVVCIGFLAALLRQILVTASETPKQQLRYARSTEAIAGAKRNSSAHPSSLAVADSYHGDLMKQTDQEPPQCAE